MVPSAEICDPWRMRIRRERYLSPMGTADPRQFSVLQGISTTHTLWNAAVGALTLGSARKPTVAEDPVEAVGHAPVDVLPRKNLHSLKP